jgi:hypothetical protein
MNGQSDRHTSTYLAGGVFRNDAIAGKAVEGWPVGRRLLCVWTPSGFIGTRSGVMTIAMEPGSVDLDPYVFNQFSIWVESSKVSLM